MGKDKKHAFTKSSQLHNRCLEALYMTTLLEYGFGFDSSHRNITLALEVLGHEVEWTLGFALAEVCVMLPAARAVGALQAAAAVVVKLAVAGAEVAPLPQLLTMLTV